MTQSESGGSAEGSSDFRVETTQDGGAATVSVFGAVDMLTAPELAAAVSRAQAGVPRGVVIDLTGVDFLGSAGLSVLVDASRTASENGSGMVIVADNHPVLHALQVTGLDAVLRVVSDRAQAIEALAD
jgi:anti-anti-sigma factor